MLPNHYRLLQLGLSGLAFVLAITVIGTAGHALQVYNNSKASNPWWLPLWPNHFDPHGTEALIGAAVVTVLCSIFHAIIIMVPKFNMIHHPTLSALVVLAAAAPGAFISLSMLAYAHILNNASPRFDTIETWTCRFKNSRSLPQAPSATSSVSNGDFGRLCTESTYAIWTTLVILLIQSALVILAFIGWFVMKKEQRRQAKQMNQWENYPQGIEMNGYDKPAVDVHISGPPFSH